MDVSVTICTFNRAAELQRTLEGFHAIRTNGLAWELLVVDNNSADNTRNVCQQFAGKLPLRYLFEPRQGKSHALNRSISEAQGDLLIFTDDDVDVDPDWVGELWSAAVRHPEIIFFGGKVIPRWERKPPQWLQENSGSLLRFVAVSLDWGDTEQRLVYNDDERIFLGASLALRKGALERAGLSFRTDLGPRAREPVRGEETFLQIRLLKAGFPGIYVPQAIVHHRNPPERMTERYVRQWFKGAGMADVRLGLAETTTKHWLFGVPRWWWPKFMRSVILYGLSRFTRPSQVWLRHERIMATQWGMICEYRAQGMRGKRDHPHDELSQERFF